MPLLLAVMLLILGCREKGDPASSMPYTPTPAPIQQARNVHHTILPTNEPLAGVYGYLPAQEQLTAHAISETARIDWNGHPLRIALVEATPAEVAGAPLGWRGVSTTLRITNDGDRAISIQMDDLLDGMSSSHRAIASDQGMRMVAPVEVSLAQGESADVDVLWFVEASEPDSMLWITADLPLSEGGYARLDAGGAIFFVGVASIDYPRGTPTPCALSATLESESLPDGSPLTPGEAFEQTWIIRNSGTCRWPARSSWTNVGGDRFGAPSTIEMETIPQPQGLLTVTVSMTAPMTLGAYRSDWRLQAPTGEPYGRTFYIEIVVTDTLPAGSTP